MSLLIRALRNPAAVREFQTPDWDILVRQARHANLLGRLYRKFGQSGLLPEIPERPLNHLFSASVMADRQHLSIRRDAFFLQEALARYEIPLILLKGAAYVLGDHPAALGRVFADIDILVPQHRLAEAESAFMLTGWTSGVLDAYDRRYYRTWMHELPAMHHLRRGTALDVHHAILPPTARLKPDPALLIDASVEVALLPGCRSLSPIDMVLHGATHLFHEGEADNLLRDLSDLDLLLRHFGTQTDFWQRLFERARQLDLSGPLSLALRYAGKLLGTPMPENLRNEADTKPRRGVRQAALDALYSRVLRPQHGSAADAMTPWARKLLYVRAHWLRMPPHLLAYHLGHKILFPDKAASNPLAKAENAKPGERMRP